ncbi:aminoglycoside phosphotransferase [Kitasatospora sp. NPDC092286]|uniref:aminoglycoside phosphotransferase n=1 Tax=Kitasatospora sp. NPDC092286 TaxID=3364087 RepID=UPI003821AABD
MDLGCELAVRIVTAGGVSVFVKGVRVGDPRAEGLWREAAVNAAVGSFSPALLWQVEADGWRLLGFEYAAGRPAGYGQDSRDLRQLSRVVRRMGQLRCPDVPLPLAEDRWAEYVDDPGLLARFAGDVLLHTDLACRNVLIRGGRTRLVGWGSATRGAAWIEAASWVLQLIAVGRHQPAYAEAWVCGIPAWEELDPEVLDAFALANVRCRQGDRVMGGAARRWYAHRLSGDRPML